MTLFNKGMNGFCVVSKFCWNFFPCFLGDAATEAFAEEGDTEKEPAVADDSTVQQAEQWCTLFRWGGGGGGTIKIDLNVEGGMWCE